jgi:hypothetical protein
VAAELGRARLSGIVWALPVSLAALALALVALIAALAR